MGSQFLLALWPQWPLCSAVGGTADIQRNTHMVVLQLQPPPPAAPPCPNTMYIYSCGLLPSLTQHIVTELS